MERGIKKNFTFVKLKNSLTWGQGWKLKMNNE